MNKLDSLRKFLVSYLPEMARNPDKLLMDASNGNIVSWGTASLGFEYAYTASIVLEEYPAHPDTVFLPLMLWVRNNQVNLVQNHDNAASQITFQVDRIDENTVDIAITLPLTEAVRVIKRPDGSGYDVQHLDEPGLADSVDPAIDVDAVLKFLYLNGQLLLSDPDAPLPDITGEAAGALAGFTQHASDRFDIDTGDAAGALGGLQQVADGAGAVTGDATDAIGRLGQTASGQLDIIGASDAALPGLDAVAEGETTILAGADGALAGLGQNADGVARLTADGDGETGGFAQDADAEPVVTGDGQAQLGALGAEAEASDVIAGDAGGHLGGLDQEADAEANVSGDGGGALGQLDAVGDGLVSDAGDIASDLSGFEQAADAQLEVIGGGAAQLQGLVQAADDGGLNTGDAAGDLGAFAGDAEGAGVDIGDASGDLNGFTQDASAGSHVQGDGDGDLGGLSQDADGLSLIEGDVADALPGLQQLAGGDATVTADGAAQLGGLAQDAQADTGPGGILASGLWDDDGVWKDEDIWYDGPTTGDAVGALGSATQMATGEPAIIGDAAPELGSLSQAAYESAAPTISITSGTGYAGSVYTSTHAGQWTADGVDIPGEAGESFTMTAAYEGAQIQCDGSNIIEMWIPTDAAQTVQAWFDARRADTLTLDGSNRVAAWASRVGSVTLTQATDSKKPTYAATGFDGAALPEVTPYGVNSYATIYGAMSNATPYLSCYTVGRYISGGGRLVSTTVAEGSADWNNTLSACVIKLDASAIYDQRNSQAQISAARTTATALMDSIWDGAQARMRNNAVSGAATAMTAAFGYNVLSLFSQQTGGDQARTSLGEVVIYHAALSSTDQAKLDGYRAWRWGLQANLPSGHAYASAPPRLQ